jgi:hypothetical protein
VIYAHVDVETTGPHPHVAELLCRRNSVQQHNRTNCRNETLYPPSAETRQVEEDRPGHARMAEPAERTRLLRSVGSHRRTHATGRSGATTSSMGGRTRRARSGPARRLASWIRLAVDLRPALPLSRTKPVRLQPALPQLVQRITREAKPRVRSVG